MTFRGGALPIGRPRAGGGRGRRIAAAVLIMLAAAACGSGAALSPDPTPSPPSQAGLALLAAPVPVAPVLHLPSPTPTPTPAPTPSPTPSPTATPTPTPAAAADDPAPVLAEGDVSAQAPAPAPAPVAQDPLPEEPLLVDSQAYAKALAAELLVLINEARAEHGVPPVAQNGALTAAAEKFAAYHFVYGDPYSLDHYLDGRPIERAAREGYHGWIGEVLVTAPLSAPELLELWLDSPGHRAVILDEFFTEVGVGCYHGPYSLASGAILYTTLCAGEFGKPM